jgi:hypothetical protein
VTDQFSVFGCGSCGQSGNPRINPPDGVRDIGAVNRDAIADEKIFGEVFFNPSGIILLLFNRPAPFSHFPGLQRGFHGRLAKGREWNDEQEKQDKNFHNPILKRLREYCQLQPSTHLTRL